MTSAAEIPQALGPVTHDQTDHNKKVFFQQI